MSELSKEGQVLALELIPEFGYKATLKRKGARIFDEIEVEYVYSADTEHAIDCIKTDQTDDMFTNSAIQNGDLLLLATSKVEPLMSDGLISDGKEYSIQDIKTVAPSGNSIVVLYGIHARG